MSTAVAKPVAEIGARAGDSRLRTLARRLTQAAASAPASVAIVGVIVAVWICERAFFGQVHDHRTIGYLAFGALPNADVPGRGSPGELWRFISSGLIHDQSSPLHLVVNSTAILTIGSVIERYYGRLVMVSTLVLGVIAGGVVWMTASALDLVAEPDYTVGCSAGISALIGMMLVYGYRHRAVLGTVQAYSMKLTATLGVSILLLMGLVIPNLNNIAHGAGFVCGVLLAMALPACLGSGEGGLGTRTRSLLVAVVGVAVLAVVLASANLMLRLTA